MNAILASAVVIGAGPSADVNADAVYGYPIVTSRMLFVRNRGVGGAVRLLAACCLLIAGFGEAAAQAWPTYETILVGDAGNSGKQTTYTTGGSLTFGAVASTYYIGKTEVTISHYVSFLNAVAKSDPRGLWNSTLASSTDANGSRSYGISRSGADGSYTYSAVGPLGTNPSGADSAGDRPITFVSLYDAVRFANWMANGRPTGAQGSATTDNGAYNVGTTTTGTPNLNLNATNPNTGAAPTYWLPTESQWYKAAYFSPTVSGTFGPSGGQGGYYTYGTQSDTAPANDIGTGTNLANWKESNADYATTPGNGTLSNRNYLTNVGAYENAESYYGAFDMTGNVREWVLTGGSDFAVRGGDWFTSTTGALANTGGGERSKPSAGIEENRTGFRLASSESVVPVPEPSTMALLGLAGLTVVLRVVRRRRSLQDRGEL